MIGEEQRTASVVIATPFFDELLLDAAIRNATTYACRESRAGSRASPVKKTKNRH